MWDGWVIIDGPATSISGISEDTSTVSYGYDRVEDTWKPTQGLQVSLVID